MILSGNSPIRESKSFEELPIKTQRMHPEYAITPFKIIPESEGFSIRNLVKTTVVKPTITKVEFKELYTDQEVNRTTDLKKMYQAASTISDLENLSRKDPITAAKKDGRIILIDGNTRAVLMKALGATSVRVNLYDLDE